MLTKQHFELIAAGFRTAEERLDWLEESGEPNICPRYALRLVRELLADDFAVVNPYFDRARFIKACSTRSDC